MANYTDFKKLMAENFGELNSQQLWALVKFAKNVRLRCRNNTAFNNFCNQTFPNATFRTVNKQRPSRTIPGAIHPPLMETYPGLEIIVKGANPFAPDDDEG